MTALRKVETTQANTIVGTTNDLIFNPVAMQQMMDLANIMAGSNATIPNHLKKNAGDCFAVIMQAAQWKMNPFAVAQKTHIVNGTLGYEAQLVNAVIMESGAISTPFSYEYRGEGNNLECRVGAIPTGKTEMLWNEWLNISVIKTKNSPLWTTNPKQQMGYLQVKNWARAFYPGAILGVYSTDELEVMPLPGNEKEINPLPEVANIVTAQMLVDKIKTMTEAQLTPDALRELDLKSYNDDEKRMIRGEITLRRKALKEAAVVATHDPEPSQAEVNKWQQLIDNATSTDELMSAYNSIPEELRPTYLEAVELKEDLLLSLGN
jgi:hypothetical protein